MTRITGCVVAAATAMLVAAPVCADERGTGTSGLPGTSPAGPAGTSSPVSAGVGSSLDALTNGCGHTMSGTVKQLDKTTGTVSIDVAGSNDVELRLPPGELAGFKEGDQVIVSMGIRESRAGTRPTEEPGGLDPDRGLGTERGIGRRDDIPPMQ